MPIKNFGDGITKTFFISGQIKKGTKWVAFQKIAKRKLDILNYASRLGDLKSPPGNNLEALKGNLRGYYSIRIYSSRFKFRFFKSGI